MMKFVLTFTKNDLTLVEINAITLNFGLDTCQIKVGIVQVNTKSVQTSDCYFILWQQGNNGRYYHVMAVIQSRGGLGVKGFRKTMCLTFVDSFTSSHTLCVNLYKI